MAVRKKSSGKKTQFPPSKYDCWLGVDVGKLSHWAHAVGAEDELLSEPVANTEEAVDALLARLPEKTLVVVDQRRNIGALVVRRAREAGLDVAYLPGIVEHKIAAATPGVAKTDRIDAEIIAVTARGMSHLLRVVPETAADVDAARVLAAERSAVQKSKTASTNALRARMLESCPRFEAACDFGHAWLAKSLAIVGGPWDVADMDLDGWVSTVCSNGGNSVAAKRLWDAAKGQRPDELVISAERAYVRRFAARIVEDAEELALIGGRIESVLSANDDYQHLKTIPGIGPKTAAQIVISVDVTDFPDHNKLASYCGLVPADNKSGTSVDWQGRAAGNKQLKGLLMFSCNSLRNSKCRYGRYMRRCLARGMTYHAAQKATARKRVKAIYAVLRDGVPYSEEIADKVPLDPLSQS